MKVLKKLAGLMMGLLAVAGLASGGDTAVAHATKGAGDEVWSLIGAFTHPVSGTELNWNEAVDFVYDAAESRYECEVALEKNDEFKIQYDHGWDKAIGFGNNTGDRISEYFSKSGENFKVLVDGYYTLIVKDDNVAGYGDRSYGFTFICDSEPSTDPVVPGQQTWELRGSFNSWSSTADYTFVWNADEAIYEIETTLVADAEFKVTADGSWLGISACATGKSLFNGNDNAIVKEAGKYHFWATEGATTWNAEKVVQTEFAVTYHDGETVLESKTLSLFADPDTLPTKDGYVIEGWYSDASCTTPIAVGAAITADTNVYVKWEKVVYTFYAINNANWSSVNVHMWGADHNTVWPGKAMTNIEGTNIWYYEIGESEDLVYTGAIVNGDGAQTQDGAVSGSLADKALVVLGEDSKDSLGHYGVELVSTRAVIAHVGETDLPQLDEKLGVTHTLKSADTVGFTAVKLSKTGEAVIDTNVTDAEKQAAYVAFMLDVDTCSEYTNVDTYESLGTGLNLSVVIGEGDYACTIEEKLAYMASLNNAEVNGSSANGNLLGSISNSNNAFIILVIGALGLSAIAAYYFLNKKRLAK